MLDSLDVEYHEITPPPPVLPPIDWKVVPGWNEPAHNGDQLYWWQRAGVEFIVGHNFRCLIGDEPRVGKTAQAVTAVNIKGCCKILVLVTRTAMSGWQDQILRWRNKGDPEPVIMEITKGAVAPVLPEPQDRPVWVLATIEGITPTTISTPLGDYDADQREAIWEAFKAAGAEEALQHTDKGGLRVILEPDDPATVQAVENVAWPDWATGERERLRPAVVRVRGPVMAALREWNPAGIIVDEAQKIKNPRAKGTKALKGIATRPLEGCFAAFRVAGAERVS